MFTDKGSKADIEAWAGSTGHQYIGTIEEDEVLRHYLRKSSGEDFKEKKHPNTTTNEELKRKLAERSTTCANSKPNGRIFFAM